MSRGAVRRKYPLSSLGAVHLPSEADNSDQAKNHFSGERNAERPFRAALRLGDVQQSTSEVDVNRFDFFQGRGSTSGQQSEQMELPADWIVESGQFAKPRSEVADPHSSVSTLLAVPIDCIYGIVGW